MEVVLHHTENVYSKITIKRNHIHNYYKYNEYYYIAFNSLKGTRWKTIISHFF